MERRAGVYKEEGVTVEIERVFSGDRTRSEVLAGYLKKRREREKGGGAG